MYNFMRENRKRISFIRKIYFSFSTLFIFKRCSTMPFNFLTSFFSFTTSIIAKTPKQPKQIRNRLSNSIIYYFLFLNFRNSKVMRIGNRSNIPKVINIPATTHSRCIMSHSNVSQSNTISTN